MMPIFLINMLNKLYLNVFKFEFIIVENRFLRIVKKTTYHI